MNINEWIALDEKEKPLDHIVTDGGMCGIFRRICCIGDSLSSGEFEAVDENGNRSYHDFYEYSWGQFIARDCGSEVLNFSMGGMTAACYRNTFAKERGFWDTDKLGQCYIMALGVNDLLNCGFPVGTTADIDLADWHNNKPTFMGDYASIIQRYRSMQPYAPFFLLTMMNDTAEGWVDSDLKEKHRAALFEIASLFDHVYVLDLLQYGPEYNKEFRERFFLRGHLNPMGYRLTATMVESYIDFIIRHNPGKFRQTGFIGKPQYKPDFPLHNLP